MIQHFTHYFPKVHKITFYGIISLMLISLLTFHQHHINQWPYYGNLFIALGFMILLIGQFMYRIRQSSNQSIQFRILDLSVSVVFLYALIQIIFDHRITWTQEIFLYFSVLVSIYIVVRSNFKEGNTQWVWTLVSVIGILCSFHGLIQYLVHLEDQNTWLHAKGFFSNSALYACLLIMTCSGSFFILTKRESPPIEKVVASLNLIATSTMVILVTSSRAAMLSALVLMLYTLKAYITRRRILPLILLTLISVGGMLIFVKKGNSIQGRQLIWLNSLDMVRDAPFFGHGLGQFPHLYNHYQAAYFEKGGTTTEQFLAANTFHAFNEYLQWTVEAGFIGLLLVLGLIGMLLLTETNHRQFDPRKGILIVVMVFSFFSYPFSSMILSAIAISCFASIARESRCLRTLEVPHWGKTFLVVSLLFCLTVVFLTSKRILVLLKWRQAYIGIHKLDSRSQFLVYESLHLSLFDHGGFLFNYGSELCEAGEYIKGIIVLKEAIPYFGHNDLYLNLGDAYVETQDYTSAETAYRHSALIVPNRFIPKYQLAKLYIHQYDSAKADSIAWKIIEMPVKVTSPVVQQIKLEMSHWLAR